MARDLAAGGVDRVLTAQDAEGPGRVAEGPRHLVRGLPLDEERPERLVHALLGVGGF